MIQQLHYATTLRYNFPQTLEDLELPRRLTELSHVSMHNAKGNRFQPYEADFTEPFTEKQQLDELAELHPTTLSTLLTPLKPVPDGTPIVGIDVSSIKVGQTATGIVCAVRVAVVWNEKRRYRFVRLGPFPFHITEESRREIFPALGQDSCSRLGSGVFTPNEAQSHLCDLIERWVQTSVSYSTRQSIILWDGSLMAGTPRSPVSVVSQTLKVARRNSNAVLAFSKGTNVRFLGLRITDLAVGHKPPCLLEFEDLPFAISKTTHLLGRVFVAKLTEGGWSFRLDIDRALKREDEIASVERLLGNELLFQGYPETLRLAHIYSTFTANDVIGVQSFLKKKYGLRVIAGWNIRKTLFGPYGTGFED